ncbi:MAG: XRE family transcriptional regulator [Neisseriaceae bacterium]|nr:MAG: XRE family transcriptional regulator [Neisseriaceae bacterium]
MKAKQPKFANPKNSTNCINCKKKMKFYRLQKNISQEYLAELSDLHRNQIGLMERAESNSLIMNIENVANSLGIKLINLLKDPPNELNC